MCNRTDCAGVFAGELACRVCEEVEMGVTEDELKKLEKLAAHVLLPFETVMEYGVGCPAGDGPVPLQVCMTRDKHDAQYITAACNAVPALIAEIRRLREAIQ